MSEEIIEALSKHRIIKPLHINLKNLDYQTVQDFKPSLQMVDPATLWVDEKYQRDLSLKSTKLIKKIIAEWSWEHFKPPIVTEYDMRLFVIDGQHTSIAAVTHPDIKEIPIFVVDIKNVVDAAKAFIAHNTNRTTVSAVQLFKARLEAGDEEAISINMALQRSGVTLTSTSGLEDKLGQLSCLSTLQKVYSKFGMMRLRQTLDICVAAKLTPIQAHYIVAVSELMFGKKAKNEEYDAQGVALVIRDYPYAQLASDIEFRARSEGKLRNAIAATLIKEKYISLFGQPDESKPAVTYKNTGT